MDTKVLLKFVLPLFFLSFFTSFIVSFVFTRSFTSIYMRWLTFLLFVISAFWSKNHKGILYFQIIFFLLTVIFMLFVGQEFHLQNSYLNRFAVYSIIVTATFISISTFWSILTRLSFGVFISSSTFDEGQERLLYLILSLLCGVLLALVIPASNKSTIRDLKKDGLSNSIGIWFVNGLIAAGLGFSIMKKFATGDAGATSVPVNTGAEYEAVN